MRSSSSSCIFSPAIGFKTATTCTVRAALYEYQTGNLHDSPSGCALGAPFTLHSADRLSDCFWSTEEWKVMNTLQGDGAHLVMYSLHLLERCHEIKAGLGLQKFDIV